ncbi:MAG TPA: methyltransferase domain-containing protein [Phycisphaerae bacterium]|nr:methyltransferase domain-containing protein [Phycisphaerae bacterium]HOJ75902.1 methyltransferase domain-containing protein [Phycisphaerae bacterium]HOM52322.1 methyltransferase domain-containing protein [Phycisphaerae bacterium]HOQ84646.1 methyltransferase domain-containing protein [Phycisphaerae bacterium]HPP24894.1 methyltransferase domain-containing protein [Phycisphaerae bacterium]
MEPDYYDEYSRIEREHWWFQARQTIVGRLIDRTVGRNRSLRILDLGCGPGESVRRFSTWGRVVGLDYSAKALSYGRCSGLRELVQGDAARLPFADASFDLVCALDILEHLHVDAAALAEMRRVCRPDGHVLITVPALPILWSEHDEINHHLRRYRRSELAEACRKAGLVCQTVSYFNTLLFPSILATRFVRRALRSLRPPTKPTSDFSYFTNGLMCRLLRGIFGFESHLVGRLPLPIGSSLLCLARPEPANYCRPASTDALTPVISPAGPLPAALSN